VARDCIDKWIDKNRHKVASDMRKRRDEEERAKLAAQTIANVEEESEDEEVVDPDAVTLKVRIEGKKKIHEVAMTANNTLGMIFEKLPSTLVDDEDFQIVCAAKRLMIKFVTPKPCHKVCDHSGLVPSASIVLKVGNQEKVESSSNFKERIITQKSLKKGSHSMHSIGIYAKDDNLRGNLVDGGGGVMYEQEVTDDEEEGKKS
jgi:hypothetical protein